MTEKKLVSVVIPTYNAEAFIEECIKETINQTYKKIEIIIVDDGSTDGTLAICEKYAKRDYRIKIISQKNQGVSVARNTGMKNATGEYIVFFDADDYPERDLIKSYVQACKEWKNKEIAFICCGMFFDNLVNKNVKNRSYTLEGAYGYIRGENYLLSRVMASTLAWLKLFNFVTNKFYDLNAIKQNNIKFNPKIHIGEDLSFNLDYLDHISGNIGMVNTPLYHYVKRTENSLSISYHANDIEDTKEIYRRFIDWENAQPNVTADNVLVLKAIYIYDWTSRLTALYGAHGSTDVTREVERRLKREIRSPEFRRMLSEIHKAKKISNVRYWSLRTGNFGIFYFMRGIYQVLKG